MKKLLLVGICTIAFLLIGTNIALRTTRAQIWLKSQIEHELSQALGAEIVIGNVDGIAPFLFRLSNVHVVCNNQAIISLASLSVVPAWYDLWMGRISIFYLNIDGIHIRSRGATPTSGSFLDSFPKKRIHIYSFSCKNIALDASLCKATKAALHYNATGTFFWNHKKSLLASSCTLEAFDGAADVGTFVTDLTYSKKKSHIHAHVTLKKPGMITLFSKLPLKALEAEVRYTFHANEQSQGTWALTSEWTSMPPIGLSGTGAWHQNKISLTCTDPKIGAHKCAGTISSVLTLGRPYAHLELSSKKLHTPEFEIADFTTSIIATQQNEQLSGSLQSKAIVNAMDFHAATDFLVGNHGAYALENMHLSMGTTKAKANVQFLLSPFRIQGSIAATSEDISQIGILLRKHIEGKGDLLATFHAGKAQAIDLSLTLKGIKTPHIHFEQAALAIKSSDLFSWRHLQAHLELLKGHIHHLEIAKASLHTHATPTAAAFQANCQGKIDNGPFEAAVKGQWRQDEEATSLEIEQLSLDAAGKNATLTHPLKLDVTKEKATLAPCEVLWEGGKFEAFAEMQEGCLAGYLKGRAVPLEYLQFFTPHVPVSGPIDFDGAISGSTVQPKIHIDFTKEQAYCALDIDSEHVQSAGEFDKLAWSAKLPIHFQIAPLRFSIIDDKPLDIAFKGALDIQPLVLPYLQEDEVVEGILHLDMAILGTTHKPQMSGGFSITNATLQIFNTGATLEDIALTALCKGDIITIERLTAKGITHGKGKIQLNRLQHFPIDVQLELKKCEVVHTDFAHVFASGKAILSGNTANACLKASCHIDKAELNLSSDFSADTPTLDIIYVNYPDPPDAAPKSPFTLHFDLDCTMPKNGFIKGRGLDSEWKGRCTLRGTNEEPLVFGSIQATKGTFVFADKKFALTKGSIEAHGDLFSNSAMYVCAAADLSDMTTQLLFTGSIKAPHLSFQSSPPYSENEILSRILFNKAFTEISPLQGLQLARVILSLNRPLGHVGIIDTLKKRIGIDHFEINKSPYVDDSNNGSNTDSVSIQVGKYIAKDVLLRLSKDVESAANRVGIEAKLHKNVHIRAEVGDDQEGQMSIMLKHDY